MDNSWSLADGETENTFPYILAIDDDRETARKHFDAGMLIPLILFWSSSHGR
jgi:hypothetical protein